MQPLQPGDPERVGRYRLGGRLGAGGMGEVYWGRSPSGRPVAVKIVHRHLATQPEFRERFAREVDAARRVGGFHTASVVDADPNGTPPWLVTAYVAGPSLDEALARNGPFGVSTLRTLGAGLAEAIEAVHAAGLVHRDLKPSNILLTEDGPRVIDFGIARALDAGGLTASGASVGTPRFMAPEQFGDDLVTGAADVFALGAVLCHAAGARPFGDGAAVAGAILTRPANLAGVPPQLAGIVGACLDKNPARRPTPAQVLDALSDGTASAGWLPPAVAAMLAEHALPDAPVPTQATPGPTMATPLLPPPTRQFTAAQPRVTAAHPPPPARRAGVAVRVAALATILVAGGIVAAVVFVGPDSGPAPDPAPPTSSTPSSAPGGDASPTATGAPAGGGLVGDWQARINDATVTVTIAAAAAGGSAYDVSVTVESRPECGGGNATGTATSSPDTSSPDADTLPVRYHVTCTDGSAGSDVDVQYTYDPGTDTLTDDKGDAFHRA